MEWCEPGTTPKVGKAPSRAMLQTPSYEHISELKSRRCHSSTSKGRRCHSRVGEITAPSLLRAGDITAELEKSQHHPCSPQEMSQHHLCCPQGKITPLKTWNSLLIPSIPEAPHPQSATAPWNSSWITERLKNSSSSSPDSPEDGTAGNSWNCSQAGQTLSSAARGARGDSWKLSGCQERTCRLQAGRENHPWFIYALVCGWPA